MCVCWLLYSGDQFVFRRSSSVTQCGGLIASIVHLTTLWVKDITPFCQVLCRPERSWNAVCRVDRHQSCNIEYTFWGLIRLGVIVDPFQCTGKINDMATSSSSSLVLVLCGRLYLNSSIRVDN